MLPEGSRHHAVVIHCGLPVTGDKAAVVQPRLAEV